MSELLCPECKSWNIRYTPAGYRVAEGVSINTGIEWCRAKLSCEECTWYIFMTPSQRVQCPQCDDYRRHE